MSFFSRAKQFLQSMLEQASGTAPATLFPDATGAENHFPARWLGGSWGGTVTLTQVGGQSNEVPFTMQFDPEGRPLLVEYGPNNLGPVTHVGQSFRAGKTQCEVRQLGWPADGVRCVITTLTESVRQQAGVWGPGYAASAEMSSAASESTWEFRKEGNGLRMLMRTVTRRDSSMRVLDECSTDHEQGEVVMTGFLQRVG